MQEQLSRLSLNYFGGASSSVAATLLPGLGVGVCIAAVVHWPPNYNLLLSIRTSTFARFHKEEERVCKQRNVAARLNCT